MTLDAALDRLLRDGAARARFRAGDDLGLGADDAAALRTLDPEQLELAARKYADDIVRRRQRGSGGLAELFPTTFAAADLDAFVASDAFGGFREVPWGGLGTSLEEAFYRWADAADVGEPAAREAEFLAAMARALVVTPDPVFTVPAELRPCPGGWFAVSARSGPTLFAAVGRLVQGPLTPFLAELLVSGPSAAARHAVAPEVLAAAQARFAALGLI